MSNLLSYWCEIKIYFQIIIFIKKKFINRKYFLLPFHRTYAWTLLVMNSDFYLEGKHYRKTPQSTGKISRHHSSKMIIFDNIIMFLDPVFWFLGWLFIDYYRCLVDGQNKHRVEIVLFVIVAKIVVERRRIKYSPEN